MLDTIRETALNLLLLVVVYVPLERAFPARQQRFFRRQFFTDLGFFLGSYVIFAGAVTVVLHETSKLCQGWLAQTAFRVELHSWPLWILLPLALMLGDLAIYWFHRACHHYDFLWRFHRVHHTTLDLDWLAAHREHPLDGLFTQLILNLPGIILGLPFHAIGGMIVFRGLWALLIHSNVALPLGPLRVLFGAPDLHHWHHANVAKTEHNFANLAPYWDIVFGTYYRPPAPESYPLGVPDARGESYLEHLWGPLVPAALRRRLDRLSRRPGSAVAVQSHH